MKFVPEFIVFLYISASVGYFTYMVFQKNRLYYISQSLMSICLVIHTILLFYYGFRCNSFPVNNFHEILSFMSWSIVAVFFLLQHKYPLRALSICAAPICAILMIGSCSMPTTLLHNTKLFQSFWLGIHVFTIFLGDASFALACASGILYIIQENAIKKKKRGFFFSRLPSLELLDNTGYACLVAGFSLLTIGLITGYIYANFVWKDFWSWDPKEVWSAIAWIFYAILLYERVTKGWRGRRSAIMSVIGFCVLLFTFLGVNFLMKGHHGPFTAL